MIFCVGTESQAVKYMTVTATAENKTQYVDKNVEKRRVQCKY